MSLNPVDGDVYSIKFVSGLRQVGVFSPGTLVFYINKTDRHDITVILLKVALNTRTITPDNVSVTCGRSMVFNGYSCFVNQQKGYS